MTTVLYGPGEAHEDAALAAAPAGLARTELVRPRTIADACRALAEAAGAKRSAIVLAGGTDWIVDRQLMDVARALPVDLVVDVTDIDALRSVELREGDDASRLVLGGGVTYWMLRTDPRIAPVVPMLARMAKDVGAVQIQTRGTLAGNIASASPAADGVAALMALDAVVTLTSATRERTVALASFFTGYRKTAMEAGELITQIDVRVPPRVGAVSRWQKVGTRLAQAISKVALASVVENEGGRITRARFGMASVGPTTASLPSVRAYLEGCAASAVSRAELDAAVSADIEPIDDVRSTAAYRLHVAKALVWRALSADV